MTARGRTELAPLLSGTFKPRPVVKPTDKNLQRTARRLSPMQTLDLVTMGLPVATQRLV